MDLVLLPYPKAGCILIFCGLVVSVAELFPVFESVKVVLPEVSILAVLEIVPVVPGATVPATVIVSLFPTPALTDAPAKDTEFPEILLVPQLAIPLTAQLTDERLIEAGTLSVISKPEALFVPLLVTVIV